MRFLDISRASLPALLILQQAMPVAADGSPFGCYSSVPGLSLKGSDTFMSTAKCKDMCGGSSVFAMQSNNCYCGSEVPSDSLKSDQCSLGCNGWTADGCGGNNAFNVYVVGGAFSTAAGSGAADSSSGAPSSAASAASSQSSAPASASATAASSSSSSSDTSSPSSSSASAASSTTTSSAPSSSSEGARTVTATATQTASSPDASTSASSSPTASSTSAPAKKKSGLGAGAIAGIVVGVVLGLLALGVLALFLWRRRTSDRGDDDDDDYYSPESSPNKFKGSGSFGESKFHSNYNTPPGGYPPPPGGYPPQLVDQRLNPGMLNHRISIASLTDARDYSRQILQVTNPDNK